MEGLLIDRTVPSILSMTCASTMSHDAVLEQSFADIARLAAELCQTAHAVICLRGADRLHLHASYSRVTGSTRADEAVCAQAPVPESLCVVPDLLQQPKLRQSLLAAGDVRARFYAAVPLQTSQGAVLGSLCVLDPEPRSNGLTLPQETCLASLARQVVTLLETQRAAEEHRKQQILQARILDSATDYAIIAMDRNGRVTRWNAGAERILGWREDEMLGDPAHVFFTPEDRAAARPETEMALALRDGRALDERWHLRKGGQHFWASGELMPLKDENGAVQGFLKILRDHTQPRADAATLHTLQDQLRLAVQATDLGIFDYDLVTGDLGWDTRVRTLFGLPPDASVTYETFLAALHPDDRTWVDQAVKAAVDPAGDGTYDIAYRTVGLEDGLDRWVAAKGQVFFAEGRAVRFIGTVRDISEIKRTEEHQRLLTGELQHRIKNTLAMVQAIANQTLRGATDIDEAREAFVGRLISLGRAHDILTQASWTAAPITEVIEGALCVHRQASVPRIRISGPNVLLAAKPALSLALALHELATNAAKYGALLNADGFVDLRWRVVQKGGQPRFCLTWSEQGGPPILSQPSRRGFGSRLIERSFSSEVGGEVKLTYASTGLICRLEAPLAAMQEQQTVAAT
ncbi:HWE histidine kinase domain-containing protein [Methylobacterium fujisawaense]|uniref:HWE histidine kinase domain-containing protein n=1 Tax=Methylobacterium fujisawaense TaxID=107400 RepID=UPI003CC79FA9